MGIALSGVTPWSSGPLSGPASVGGRSHWPVAGLQVPEVQNGPAAGPAAAPQLQTPDVQVSLDLQVELASQRQVPLLQTGLGWAQAALVPQRQTWLVQVSVLPVQLAAFQQPVLQALPAQYLPAPHEAWALLSASSLTPSQS